MPRSRSRSLALRSETAVRFGGGQWVRWNSPGLAVGGRFRLRTDRNPSEPLPGRPGPRQRGPGGFHEVRRRLHILSGASGRMVHPMALPMGKLAAIDTVQAVCRLNQGISTQDLTVATPYEIYI